MKVREVKQKKEKGSDLEPIHETAMPEAAVFILVALGIIFFGIIMLYSTSFAMQGTGYFTKQLMWMGVGAFGFLSVVLIGYKTLSDCSPLWLLGICGLLALTLMFDPIKGARRWIRIGGFGIQPSEYAKVVLVLFLAWFLSRRTRLIETSQFFRVFVPGGFFCSFIIILVIAGKDLGTTLLLCSVFLIMMFVAGIKKRYILAPILAGGPALFYLIKHFDAERWSRMTTFMDPETVQANDGYQLWHSLLALGSGNWLGIGFTESRLKLKYLPEAHTDFILAIVGEELGFVSLCGIILAYLIFLTAGFRIGMKARTRQGMLVAFGMISFMGIQAIINIGVICGALPTKGMPAPLISYGGSNLVACMLAIGCVFSVALDNTFPDYELEVHEKFRKFFHLAPKKENSRKASKKS